MPQDRARRPARAATRWRLALLGSARLERDGTALEPLERRSAALLAHLALEGPTPRSKLAGLLWPESTEDAARANLRQRLKRLRESLGTELVMPDETLGLRSNLEVDAVKLESLAFTGEYEAALRLDGALLDGHDYDDCPDLEAWVLSARERLENTRREALTALCDRAERGGEYALALGYAERLIRADPISEEAHRRAMRLHFLAGDRSAALSAYERCREVLLRELGLEPLPETVELSSVIALGSSFPETPAPIRSSIPVSVLRPPVLAGREREWARLEAAWEARQVAFISGPPGCGKTRLMMDFAASKGAISVLEGRPGDDGVPYSTHARSLRRFLASRPEVLDTLEPWVRRELSRLAPELEPEAAPPIRDESEKLRFFQAIAHLTRTFAGHDIASIALDDLQFMDAGSFEIGAFITARSLEDATHRAWPRSLNAFRSGELPPEIEARVRELVESGAAILIELEPLGADAVSALLDGIQVAGLERLAPAMARYTGGNPLFIVETVKHLIETQQLERASLEGALPMRLLPPGKVGPLIRRRLERLTPGALRLAQAAAVAGTDFDLELGARVLGTDALELTQAIVELEGAQVTRGLEFAHDLIQEATLEGVPNTIRTLLHRRIADYLETVSAAPARIAHHWLEAGDQQKAVPHLRDAALASAAAYRFEEAIAFNLRAADLLEAQGQQALAFERVAASQGWAQTMGSSAQTEALLARLERMAVTPVQRGYAQLGQAQVLFDAGEVLEAEQIVREAREQVRSSPDLALRGELSALLGVILWVQGRYEECAPLFEEAVDLNEQRGDIVNVTINLTNLAALQSTLLRHQQSIASFQRALKTLETKDDLVVRTGLLTNLGTTQMQMGQGRVARETLLQSRALLDQMPDVLERQLTCLYQLGTCGLQLDDYRDAIHHSQRVLELAPALDAHVRPSALRNLAVIALALGREDEAEVWLERAMSVSNPRPDARVSMLIVQGLIASRIGLGSLEWFDVARDLNVAHPVAGIALRLWRASALPAPDALRLSLEALEITQQSESFGAQIMARTRSAQALLQLGDSGTALEQTVNATRLLEDYDALPLGFHRVEVLLTHHRALEANRHPDARAALRRALNWVLETADQRVPPEYRDSFLTRNPVNAAILEAARAAKLTR
jgi:DNA-binding SARP family transcriptional activator/Tfp pilus assembly protein PilF